jgi:hypothetical protein
MHAMDGCRRFLHKSIPAAFLIQSNLNILFPRGASKAKIMGSRYIDAFGVDLCDFEMRGGTLIPIFPKTNRRCKRTSRVHQMHGIYYIADLEFCPSAPVQKRMNILIGDGHFQRDYDDHRPRCHVGFQSIMAHVRSRHHPGKFSQYQMDGKPDKKIGMSFRRI